MHQVTIKLFAIGKFEVTFEEYDRFAIAMGRPFTGDQGWGRGRRPVINVSWEDAKDYAGWLSRQTGKRFRLPTESEWEYAARSIDKNRDDIWAGTMRCTGPTLKTARRLSVKVKEENPMQLVFMT